MLSYGKLFSRKYLAENTKILTKFTDNYQNNHVFIREK
jgi:hypothetical protein